MRSTRARPIWLRPPAGASPVPSANGLRRFQVSDAIRTPSEQNTSIRPGS